MDQLPSIIELLATKAHAPEQARRVVQQAADKLADKLREAKEPFEHSRCEDDYYAYALLTLHREIRGKRLALEIKIAEIRNIPYAFANVHEVGKPHFQRFPFFAEIDSEEGKLTLLHYLTDFLLSAKAH